MNPSAIQTLEGLKQEENTLIARIGELGLEVGVKDKKYERQV